MQLNINDWIEKSFREIDMGYADKLKTKYNKKIKTEESIRRKVVKKEIYGRPKKIESELEM